MKTFYQECTKTTNMMLIELIIFTFIIVPGAFWLAEVLGEWTNNFFKHH